ncbi:MAG: rhomboid family intramembrane serine protease [Bacilli bacterium]|nr:rhomboid family intramembrane serine protease [Bacilli bacterium]
MAVVMNKKDELVIMLAHYFVTEENYTPIIVNGVKDEVWLENTKGPYRIIRINSNHIHNDEQLKYDLFKTKNIMRQVRKKTLSFTMNTLNIFLDLGDNVNLKPIKNIDSIKIGDVEEIKNQKDLNSLFPKLKDKALFDHEGFDLLIDATNDINVKTEENNKLFEDTFKPKFVYVTLAIIGLCLLMFLITTFTGGSSSAYNLFRWGANLREAVVSDKQVWRLLTCAFLHAGILHLLVNMYSLFIIGSQIETYMGKIKYAVIYIISAISGSLLSIIFSENISVGASGAIFGLLGSLLYFGYHYRVYLGTVIRTQIVPIIILNLAIGFMFSGIDNFAHIGGLIGGYLATMAVGVRGRSSKSDMVNGSITLILYLGFLVGIAFFYVK